eukprot:gnl/TRDRNA2_/TRDRNA2_82901_c0_seq1.p1 gnl/TRDRNA2_/TRDRNA2_82901_c0~~gnl/TRDRNA2_/TRDRNA2_82901_c0_seq1.p1  ORF type:complete len:281 (-),score=31.30 gnl/TRDRNA2_/TRDRNA2_82901_c0_seq1:493-1335(-)
MAAVGAGLAAPAPDPRQEGGPIAPGANWGFGPIPAGARDIPGVGPAAAAGEAAVDGAAALARQVRMLVHAWGALLHGIIFCIGSMLWLHALQVGATLHVQGQGKEDQNKLWDGMYDAAVLFGRNLLMPFMEVAQVSPFSSQAPSIAVWGVWIPGFLSGFLVLTSGLGLSAFRHRKTTSVVVYSMLAAILLVWQAQAGHTLLEFSSWEDLLQRTRPRDIRKLEQQIFKVAHDAFTQLFSGPGPEISASLSSRFSRSPTTPLRSSTRTRAAPPKSPRTAFRR